MRLFRALLLLIVAGTIAALAPKAWAQATPGAPATPRAVATPAQPQAVATPAAPREPATPRPPGATPAPTATAKKSLPKTGSYPVALPLSGLTLVMAGWALCLGPRRQPR
jgi:hypothetical protein